jgi:hypothetical protein
MQYRSYHLDRKRADYCAEIASSTEVEGRLRPLSGGAGYFNKTHSDPFPNPTRTIEMPDMATLCTLKGPASLRQFARKYWESSKSGRRTSNNWASGVPVGSPR